GEGEGEGEATVNLTIRCKTRLVSTLRWRTAESRVEWSRALLTFQGRACPLVTARRRGGLHRRLDRSLGHRRAGSRVAPHGGELRVDGSWSRAGVAGGRAVRRWRAAGSFGHNAGRLDADAVHGAR